MSGDKTLICEYHYVTAANKKYMYTTLYCTVVYADCLFITLLHKMSTDISTYDLQLLVNFKHFLAKTYLTSTDEI